MGKIINMTPHKVSIVDEKSTRFDASQRKYLADNPIIIKEVAPSGQLLNAKLERKPAEAIDGIPTVETKIVAVDELPDDGNYYIVSALYVAARRQLGLDTSRCLTIGEAVYSADSIKPIGTLNLNRN